jgi:glycosyltransferase 2 family protein
VTILKRLLLVVGVLVLGILVYRVGLTAILDTLARLAWWQFLLVSLPYGLIAMVDTLGWRFAFARDRAPFWRLFGARLAGEALNLATALGSVGGEGVKAWLVRRDVTYAESVPSIIVAKTTITLAQSMFLVLGIVVAWFALPLNSGLLRAMLVLYAVEVLGVGGFLGVQVAGLVGRAGRLLARFGVVTDPSHAERLDGALRAYYRGERGRFALSASFHLLGWILNAGEAYLMLRVLGVDVTPAGTVVIEALGSAVRFATFLVPASLGVLEGVNAATFEALGLTAAAGLAFSFVRRARQVVWVGIGLAVLVAMRWTETRAAARAGADGAA